MTGILQSILCSEIIWCWDWEGGNTIKFNADGTGELQCRIELIVFIAAEFDWKSAEPLDRIVNAGTHTHCEGPHPLGQLNIELTLSKRRTPPFRSGPLQHGRINEVNLTDDAFRPKAYTIRLEKGNFITPCDARAQVESNLTERFALRLLLDKSPYPPRYEWQEPEGGPDANQFWDWKEFAGHKSPELKRLAAENRIQLSRCVVS